MLVHFGEGFVVFAADVDVGSEVGSCKAELVKLLAHHDCLDIVEQEHEKEQAHREELDDSDVFAVQLLR